MKKTALALVVLLAIVASVAATLSWSLSESRRIALAEQRFALEVWPLLESKCVACHGADSDGLEGELDMTSLAGLLRGGESGEPALVPGEPKESLLVRAIHREELAMPPKEQDRLSAAEIATIEAWIAEGAVWPDDQQQLAIRRATWQLPANDEGIVVKTSGGLSEEWTYRRYQPEEIWAYLPLPEIEFEAGGRNPIDAIIERRLELIGLESAPEADPRTLIRRVTFDVLGLPPQPAEVDEFLLAWQQDSDKAWRALVDRLLASPHYGEQMARHWLDVVRYADSGGFANDWPRPNAWRYRDYVIRSFNDDKPYDQFIREQIAGDEIDPHDPEMKVAVGFLRMGPWEHSFMSVPTVSRQLFLDDVTASVGQVFLAQPLQCARCHDHKFDPVPTRDYYAIQAVFSTTQVADANAAWLPGENLAGMESDKRLLLRKRAWNEETLEELKRKIAVEEAMWFYERGLPYQSRRQALKAGYDQAELPEYRVGLTPDELGSERIHQKWKDCFALESYRYEPVALSVYDGKTNLPKGINKRLPVPADPMYEGEWEQTHVLAGGDPFSPTDPVVPGILSAANGGEQIKITQQPLGRRLAFARWLTSPENPLTARVMVNRLWQMHFGKGIVATPNNFGSMGKRPTHPMLLNLLAKQFIEGDWSLKQLHRLILTSKTYRRASKHPQPEMLERLDPEQKLYAAFAPRRLAAEELRDAMLSISGELNRSVGGIPARPDINLEAALRPRLIMGTFAPAYVPHPRPEQRNRRTIYALKLRGLRDPFLEVFNQPSPDIACELRDQSNVTPQVFALMNSQESADRALALAERLLQSSPEEPQVVEKLFAFVFGRRPTLPEALATVDHWRQMQQLQAELNPTEPTYPTEVVRRANDENSGQVFEFTEPLFAYEEYVSDLQPHQVDARTRALADVCLMMLNSNEFAYLY